MKRSNVSHATAESCAVLMDMLRTRRPHGSEAEKRFMLTFIKPLGVTFDEFGNAYKQIGDSPLVFACHVDTVHSKEGAQLISLDKHNFITLGRNSKSNCLGADDTAGVWLMYEMIKAEKPGLYIFHRGEERGCLGSNWIVSKTPELVKDRKAIISLDRKGYTSVITKQTGGRCCSDDFGRSLAKQMEHTYKLDDGGLVTDSAKYTDLIGECTNLSVGYMHQHSDRENLHFGHLLYVRQQLLKLDHDKLEFKRPPGDTTDRYKPYVYKGRGYGGYPGCYGDQDYYGEDYDRRYDSGGHYSNPDYVGDGLRVPATFIGGYWKKYVWQACDRETWTEKLAEYTEKLHEKRTRFNTEKSKATALTVVKDREPGAEKEEDLPGAKELDADLLSMVYRYPKTLARMLADWGFDAEALRDNMNPYGDSVFKAFTQAVKEKEKRPTVQ